MFRKAPTKGEGGKGVLAGPQDGVEGHHVGRGHLVLGWHDHA